MKKPKPVPLKTKLEKLQAAYLQVLDQNRQLKLEASTLRRRFETLQGENSSLAQRLREIQEAREFLTAVVSIPDRPWWRFWR